MLEYGYCIKVLCKIRNNACIRQEYPSTLAGNKSYHWTGNLSMLNALIRSMHFMHLWAEHQEEMWSTVHRQCLEILHHFTFFFWGYLQMHCAFAKAFCGCIAQKPHATCASRLVREQCSTHGLNTTPWTFTLKEQQLSLWTNICLLQAKCSGEKTKQTNRKQFC